MLGTRTKRLFIVLGLALLGAIGLSSGHFENPDAHLRLAQAFLWRKQEVLSLEMVSGTLGMGMLRSMTRGSASAFGPGQIAIFMPIAMLAQEFNLPGGMHPHYLAELIASFVGVAIHFLTGAMVFIAAVGIGRSRREAAVLTVLFCFCTFNLASSRDGYEHPYEALLILMSYITAWKYQDTTDASLGRWLPGFFFAGLLLSIGLLFRPTTILAVPGLFIICRRLNNIVKASLGLAFGIAILGLYNQARFGSPIETGYLQAWLTANPAMSESGFSAAKTLPQAVALWISPGRGCYSSRRSCSALL